MSKDMLLSIIGCGNLLWSKKTLGVRALVKTTQSSISLLMPELTGATPPSSTDGAVITLDISGAFTVAALVVVSGVDLRRIKTGGAAFGPYVFDLAGAEEKVAVMVGTEGTRPNRLAREVNLKVGEDATHLLFLHACAIPATNKEAYRLIWDMADSADLLGWYEVVYEDGLPEVIPIRYGVNILEWNWGRDEKSRAYCYDAKALQCSPDSEHPITFFMFEWESPRLGKVIREVRLKGSRGFRGAVPGFENSYGAVIPNNAVILKALSFVKKRG